MMNYYCESCNKKEYSTTGNPLNCDDGVSLCDRCYNDREVKCDGCGKKVHHEEIEIVKNEKYCQRCVLITE